MKKKFSRILSLILILCFALPFAASCAEGAMDGGYYSGPSYIPSRSKSAGDKESLDPAGEYMDALYDDVVRDGEGDKEGKIEKEDVYQRPGQITASAWDDNTYYSMWKDLFVKGQSESESGKFVSFKEDNWGFDTAQRVKVTVTDGSAPVKDAIVTAFDGDDKPVFIGRTDVNGVAYLFPPCEEGTVKTDGSSASFTAEVRELTLETAPSDVKNVIQMMFVVDVTGSMGDEISFLKAELGDVIARIAKQAEAKIYLGFLFYRDDEDKDEFTYVDFRDVTDPADYKVQQATLAKQSATGGGDYPEAVDKALEIAASKQWMDGATKLIFHVLDAPAHDKKENKERYSQAVNKLSAYGVRVCPVLASGANSLCEYITRTEAIVTGGTFVYITNDSGIGGDHLDPELPNVVVELLNDLMVRLIVGYHTGTFAEPVYWRDAQAQQ